MNSEAPPTTEGDVDTPIEKGPRQRTTLLKGGGAGDNSITPLPSDTDTSGYDISNGTPSDILYPMDIYLISGYVFTSRSSRVMSKNFNTREVSRENAIYKRRQAILATKTGAAKPTMQVEKKKRVYTKGPIPYAVSQPKRFWRIKKGLPNDVYWKKRYWRRRITGRGMSHFTGSRESGE